MFRKVLIANRGVIACRVIRTLRRMGHDVIGMEQYAAEGSRPVDRCKRDVALADCYVLMLGWRYGYVPDDENADRLSITEIEYRHAIEKQRTVLAFLLDPEEPWPPSSMDSASADVVAATAVNRFRDEVGREYLFTISGMSVVTFGPGQPSGRRRGCARYVDPQVAAGAQPR